MEASLKLLVVEEDPISQAIIVKQIEGFGYSCLGCRDDNFALKPMEQHLNIAFLISDIVMEGMDGRALVKQVRAQDRFLDLPFDCFRYRYGE
ncbi:MAG: response regulator [Bdellovibrionales bacterium]|nr:response regulator [Bdellovibrionales bacterium]